MSHPIPARLEVTVEYDASQWPAFDKACEAAAGRPRSFSGLGMGRRDLGWSCASEIDAHRIKRALTAIGLQPKIVQRAEAAA